MSKKLKFKPKEVYHILWCLSENIELDYFDHTKRDCGITPALGTLMRIIMYLNGCPCKKCRGHIKELRWWLKEIRKKKSYWRMKK